MSSEQTRATKATLDRHMAAFGARDVDKILEDFTEESVIFGPEGPARGLAALRRFFVHELAAFTPEIVASFKVLRLDIDGEVGYMTFSGGPSLPFGTDTYIVRDGKIAIETTAAYTGESKG